MGIDRGAQCVYCGALGFPCTKSLLLNDLQQAMSGEYEGMYPLIL